ncbi:TPA: DedA family protein [Morganella morganii]|nr:DedA family protein [Morganella morganii]
METLLTHWITEYGYWATFFGTMIEGETAAFLSGIAAHHQLLSYPKVMLVAALGGIISDNVLFFTGYFAGNRILPRIHKHADKIARLQRIIHRRESLIIIGIRFAYGLRTIGPVIIGSAGINPLKFFVLNILGGAIWGSVIVSAGYFVSATILALPLHTYLAWFLILAAVAGLFVLIRKHKFTL